MSINRIFTCDIPGCDRITGEPIEGAGAQGWGQMNGVMLNECMNPHLCPGHLAMVMNFIDRLEGPPEAIDLSIGEAT